ncbi:MAG: DUF3574 domain-containing protein [Thermoanaerobaculia bacterium]
MPKNFVAAVAAAGLTAAGLVSTGVLVAEADAQTSAAVSPVGDRFARTELYFGTDKPGPDVTDAQFRRFVRQQVTPRFPDGLTQLEALGQFENAQGKLVRERSKVIILLYPVADREKSSADIEAIRDAYEKAFQQESVLRADSVDLVSF